MSASLTLLYRKIGSTRHSKLLSMLQTRVPFVFFFFPFFLSFHYFSFIRKKDWLVRSPCNACISTFELVDFFLWNLVWTSCHWNPPKIDTSLWGYFYSFFFSVNPLKPELNPIWYLLALLGVHHFLHISRIRVKLLTFRLLMSYIYGAPILDVSRLHTMTQHSR